MHLKQDVRSYDVLWLFYTRSSDCDDTINIKFPLYLLYFSIFSSCDLEINIKALYHRSTE